VIRRALAVLSLMGLLLSPTAVMGGDTGGGDPDAPEALRRRGTTRIEFDPRMVEGQTKKAGAIYLFQRKDAEIKSLVKRRKDFREEVLKKLDD
jgi:hypothetical protein